MNELTTKQGMCLIEIVGRHMFPKLRLKIQRMFLVWVPNSRTLYIRLDIIEAEVL